MEGKHGYILVVEDEKRIRELESNSLKNEGYTVTDAKNGVQALELIKGNSFDLVLLDIIMPDIDGIKILKTIRQEYSMAELPVIMVTAMDKRGDIVKGLDLGACDYVTKPIDIPVLLARIRTQMARKQAEDALRRSEAKYRGLFESAHGGFLFYRILVDHTVELITPNCKDIFGYKPEDFYKDPGLWTKTVHPEDRERVADVFQQAFQGDKIYLVYKVINSVTREEKWVYTTCSNTRDEKGDVISIDGYLFDITELKKAEEVLSWETRINKATQEILSAFAKAASLDDISHLILEHGKRITGSEFGYVGYIDSGTGHLSIPALTRHIWETCRAGDKDAVFKEFKGLYGWVLKNRKPLLTNNPAKDSRSSGAPEGHVPIHRFISAPALVGETLVGQVSFANSDRDYTESDLLFIEQLAIFYALAVSALR